MEVSSIMSKPVITVREDATLDEVARTMLDKRIGCVVVVDHRGVATGILSERDFAAKDPANPFDPHRSTYLFGKNVRLHGLESVYSEARRIRARQLQRPIQCALSEVDPIERAMELMHRYSVLHLVVLEKGKPTGIVSRHDLLQLAAEPQLAM